LWESAHADDWIPDVANGTTGEDKSTWRKSKMNKKPLLILIAIALMGALALAGASLEIVLGMGAMGMAGIALYHILTRPLRRYYQPPPWHTMNSPDLPTIAWPPVHLPPDRPTITQEAWIAAQHNQQQK
jgi:hypothetical protein